MKKNEIEKVLMYVSTRSNDMVIDDISSLKDQINAMLEEKINYLSNNPTYQPKIERKLAAHHNPDRNIEMIKAFLGGETAVSIAARFNVTPPRVATIYNSLCHYFHLFLRLNYSNPVDKKSLAIKKISQELKDQFLWYIKHHDYIIGYKLSDDIHIPISIKPINQAIQDTDLSDDIKAILYQNGFSNMSEIAKFSILQIKNIPMIDRAVMQSIMNYFENY